MAATTATTDTTRVNVVETIIGPPMQHRVRVCTDPVMGAPQASLSVDI